jgi:hypothetical protein
VHAHFYIFLNENFRLAMEKVMKNRKPQSRLFFFSLSSFVVLNKRHQFVIM